MSVSGDAGQPRRWTVSLPTQKATGKNIGLRVEWADDCKMVEVLAVREGGILAEHNRRNPDRALEPGDMILTVNGVNGDAMKAELKNGSGSTWPFEVVVERPPQRSVARG